jgi:Icc protein
MATVVQITDLHVHKDTDGRLLGVPTWETLDDVLALLDHEVPDWDLLVLTGDLAQDEERASYEALAERLGERLKRTRMIPGNHDNPEAMRAVFPDAFDDSGARFVEVVGGWLLLGLDSHVDGQVSGQVDESQTRWAQEQIDARPGLPVVLFVHHPPVAIGSAWLDAMGLDDPEPLHDLVRRNPDRVQAVFCGHVHQDTRTELEGVPVFTSPSTAFQFAVGQDDPGFDPLPPGLRVLKLTDRLETWVIRTKQLRFEPVYREAGGY